MNRARYGVVLAVAAMVLFSTAVQAATFISREKVAIPSYQTYPGNVFIKGQDVVVNGRIKGDLFVLGKNVAVRGTVKGDIHVLGEHVAIVPQEADDVRVVGKDVYVRGKIFNDIMVLGRNVNIGGNCFGCAYVFAKKLMLSPYTLLRGDLWYVAETALSPSAAVVRRVLNAELFLVSNVPTDAMLGLRRAAALLSFVLFLISIAFLLVVAGIVVKFMPNQMKMVNASIQDEPLQSIGVGALTFVAAPLCLFVLAATVIGLPFAFIAGVLYAVLLVVSKIFVSLVIGDALIARVITWRKGRAQKKRPAFNAPYLAFLLGFVVYQVVGVVPYIGGLFRFFAMLLGLGAIVRTRPQTFRLARKKGVL